MFYKKYYVVISLFLCSLSYSVDFHLKNIVKTDTDLFLSKIKDYAQEDIQNAIVELLADLPKYNQKMLFLDTLSQKLDIKIGYIKKQMMYHFRYDRKVMHDAIWSMSKSVLLLLLAYTIYKIEISTNHRYENRIESLYKNGFKEVRGFYLEQYKPSDPLYTTIKNSMGLLVGCSSLLSGKDFIKQLQCLVSKNADEENKYLSHYQDLRSFVEKIIIEQSTNIIAK